MSAKSKLSCLVRILVRHDGTTANVLESELQAAIRSSVFLLVSEEISDDPNSVSVLIQEFEYTDNMEALREQASIGLSDLDEDTLIEILDIMRTR